MALALNKTTLKQQRDQAKTYRQFLPSLELKRQQLLAALKSAKLEKQALDSRRTELYASLEEIFPLLGSSTIATRNISSLVRLESVDIEEENVLGTRLPVVREVNFVLQSYSKLIAPFWVDELVSQLKVDATLRVQQQVADQRVLRLELASRRITQRVNLFEKVLIPRAEEHIRRIVIFLSDQERAAVVRSKIAKSKDSLLTSSS